MKCRLLLLREHHRPRQTSRRASSRSPSSHSTHLHVLIVCTFPARLLCFIAYLTHIAADPSVRSSARLIHAEYYHIEHDYAQASCHYTPLIVCSPAACRGNPFFPPPRSTLLRRSFPLIPFLVTRQSSSRYARHPLTSVQSRLISTPPYTFSLSLCIIRVWAALYSPLASPLLCQSYSRLLPLHAQEPSPQELHTWRDNSRSC